MPRRPPTRSRPSDARKARRIGSSTAKGEGHLMAPVCRGAAGRSEAGLRYWPVGRARASRAEGVARETRPPAPRRQDDRHQRPIRWSARRIYTLSAQPRLRRRSSRARELIHQFSLPTSACHARRNASYKVAYRTFAATAKTLQDVVKGKRLNLLICPPCRQVTHVVL